MFRLWKCDNSTYDIVTDDLIDDEDDGIVACNVSGHELAEAYLKQRREAKFGRAA